MVEGNQLLQHASNTQPKEMVAVTRALAELRADEHARARVDKTAFHRAAGAEHVEGLRALMELGADTDVHAKHALGIATVHWAGRFGQVT